MDHPLSLSSTFFKGHGHGNDYLVFEEGHSWPVTKKAVQILCHPHRGVGSDGIVALLRGGNGAREKPGKADSQDSPSFSLRMFNPDGSEFERSGNGLRILGAYLFSEGRVGLNGPFSVQVGGEQVEMEILGEEANGVVEVAVEMGKARFGVDAVGGDRTRFGPGPTLPGLEGSSLGVHLVSVGNPHCTLFLEDPREEDLLRLGPFLASNPAFSSGTNVQLAKALGERQVQILIWERGVGRTASSGTSACAVAAAGVRSGHLAPGRIQVGMEGGSFTVEVSPNMDIRLEGPVQPVYAGKLTAGMIGGLREAAGG